MKLNKGKNKGKVHPSPSSSSSSSSCTSNSKKDPISTLNHLLPTTILTLISILSLQDKEVLTYMITHSIKSTSFDPKNNKKPHKSFSTSPHKSPTFDCCCFVCFSSYWNRWNSSPHSKLIDQAIEAFEEHLSKTEKHTKNKNGEKISVDDVEERYDLILPEEPVGADVAERESENGLVFKHEEMGLADVEERENEGFPVAGESGTYQQGQHQQHKGLARKVLPDFIGFFQSRLWNRLWGPNV